MEELAQVTDVLTIVFSYLKETEGFLTICNTCREWRSLYLNHFKLHDSHYSFHQMNVMRGSILNYVLKDESTNSEYGYCQSRETFLKQLMNTMELSLDHQNRTDLEDSETGFIGFIKGYVNNLFSSLIMDSFPQHIGNGRPIVKKIIVTGRSGVGKSTLLESQKYCVPVDNDKNYTIGVEFHNSIVVLTSDVTYKLQIWDAVGHGRFRTIMSAYCRGANLVLLCFSITDQESFRQLDSWIANINEYAATDIEMILVGLKSDLQEQRTVPYQEAKELANKLRIPYFEASGKEYINIVPLFVYATCLLYCKDQLKSIVDNRCITENI
jgi:small GTP-binding protein